MMIPLGHIMDANKPAVVPGNSESNCVWAAVRGEAFTSASGVPEIAIFS
jgi:hypothetical protein